MPCNSLDRGPGKTSCIAFLKACNLISKMHVVKGWTDWNFRPCSLHGCVVLCKTFKGRWGASSLTCTYLGIDERPPVLCQYAFETCSLTVFTKSSRLTRLSFLSTIFWYILLCLMVINVMEKYLILVCFYQNIEKYYLNRLLPHQF